MKACINYSLAERIQEHFCLLQFFGSNQPVDKCVTHSCLSLIQEIHSVHNYEGKIYWRYILRESNQVVDLLADHEMYLATRFHIFEFAPQLIYNALIADFAGICFPSQSFLDLLVNNNIHSTKKILKNILLLIVHEQNSQTDFLLKVSTNTHFNYSINITPNY